MAIQFLLLISRQGKVRLSKWYRPVDPKEKAKIIRELIAVALRRSSRMCNVVEYQSTVPRDGASGKGLSGPLLCRRYASLSFIAQLEPEDNELIALEAIHLYVEVLDKYFGNVCELDIIFHFYKAYYALDEVFLNGEVLEGSKAVVLKHIHAHEKVAEEGKSSVAAVAAYASSFTRNAGGMD